MPETDKLILIDAMALVYRGHFAMIRNPRLTSDGQNTSTVFVFCNVLLQLIEKEKPTHLAVAFDRPEPTFRHKRFPEYKATRDAMPEDIEWALPRVRRLVEAFRIPLLELAGWEADDIIGTVADRAAAAGVDALMVTPDKDYAQLVGEHRRIMRPQRGSSGFEVLDAAAVCEQWGIERVDQVVDILGLMGDASDNVPGVPGIGQKTAQKLVAEFGSIAGVYERIDQVKGKRRENLEANRHQAFLSRELVTIDRDVPVEADIEGLRCQEVDRDAVSELFEELEFRTLASRVLGDEHEFEASEANDEPATMAEVFHTYRQVDDDSRAEFLKGLSAAKRLCVDTETDGLDPYAAGLLGIAFCWQEHEAWYLPWPSDAAAGSEWRQLLNPVLGDTTVTVIGHHLKFDLAVLARAGFTIAGPLEDTLLAATLALPDLNRRTMDALSEHLLYYRPQSITELIGPKGPDQLSMADVPLEKVVPYACEDADVTFQLATELVPLVEESGQLTILNDIENPLVPALVAMESEGITVDVAALGRLGEDLQERIDATAARISEIAGEDVNINSPKQLGEVLFDKLQLDPKAKRTAKTGQYQTGEAILQRLAPKHEIVRLILEYRAATKLKSTYVDQLPTAVAADGRIHTTYEQAVTATGRMASHNPNLQNIPVRSEQGREIRKAFISRGDDWWLLAADYSQIELRIAAAMSGDEALKGAFVSGHDIHTATAALVYGVEPEDVDAELRRRAKTINFGILYGVSAWGLSERLDIPRYEGKALIDGYFERFHRLAEWLEEVKEGARERGYVETISGRRRWFRDIASRNHAARSAAERTAINAPVQGTAADLIKLAMVRIHALLDERQTKSRMLLQVHDELVFDLHDSERDWLPELIVEAMETALPMEVPLVVETGIGKNWLEAH
jgi:DNA polymerase-1